MALPVLVAPFEEVTWIHNWNSPKWIELQQIRVATHNTGCIFAHRKLQKFIVVRIATGPYLFRWVGEVTSIHQCFYECTALIRREIVVKFFAGDHVIDLFEGFLRK